MTHKNSTLTTAAAALLSTGLAAGTQPASAQVNPSQDIKNVLLVHGAFADGSSWVKVIAPLQKKGCHVIAVSDPPNLARGRRGCSEPGDQA